MNEKQEDSGNVGIASIPDDVCQRCMKPAEQQEVMIVEVSYPGSYQRSKLCLDCQADLCFALSKAVSSVFCEMVPPRATRTHRLWHILKLIVQIIVYGVMLILILGIILIFVLIPVLVPQR